MNIVLEIIIFNVVVFTICGINMAKKGRLGLIQEYPKAIQNRCRELGLIEESSGKLMKKARIFYRIHSFADGIGVLYRRSTHVFHRLAARLSHVGGRNVV